MSGKIGQNELTNFNSGLTLEDFRKVYSENPDNINKGYVRLIKVEPDKTNPKKKIGLEKINNWFSWALHWTNLSKSHNQALRNELVKAMEGGIGFCKDFIQELTKDFVSSAGTGSAGKVSRLEIKELFRRYDEKFNTPEGRREICGKMVDEMLSKLGIESEMRRNEYRILFARELSFENEDAWFATTAPAPGETPRMSMREADFRTALGVFASRLASVRSEILACESLRGALTGCVNAGGTGLKLVDLAAKEISGEINQKQKEELVGGMKRELHGLRNWLEDVAKREGLKGCSSFISRGVETDFIYILSQSSNAENMRAGDFKKMLDGIVGRMREFSDKVQNPGFSKTEQAKMDEHVKVTTENLEGNLENTGASKSSRENMKDYVRESEDVHIQQTTENNVIGNYIDGVRHGKNSVYVVETGEVVDDVIAEIKLDASKLERKAKFIWGPESGEYGLDKLVGELTEFIESMTDDIEEKVNERTFPTQVKDYLLAGLKNDVLPNLLGDVLREIEANSSANVPAHMILKDRAEKAIRRIVDDFVKLAGALRLVRTSTGKGNFAFLANRFGMKVFNDQIKQIQKANIGNAQKLALISDAQKGLSKVLSATLSAYLISAHEGKSILSDVTNRFDKALNDAIADFDERMSGLNDEVSYSLIELRLADRPDLLERCRSLPMLWFVDDRLESGEDDEGSAIAKLQPSIWRASVVEVINGYKGEINPDDDAVMDKINDAYSKRMKKTVDKYVKFRTSVSNGFAAALRKEAAVLLKDNPAVKDLPNDAVKALSARLVEHTLGQNRGRLVDVLAEEFLLGDKKANVNRAVAQLVSGKGTTSAVQLEGLLVEWQMAGEKFLNEITGQEVNHWGHKVEHHHLTNAIHSVAESVVLKLEDAYKQDFPDVSKFCCERQNVGRAMVNRILADLRAHPATFGEHPFGTFMDRYCDEKLIEAEAKSYLAFRKQFFEKTLSNEDRAFIFAPENERLLSHVLDFAVSEAYVDYAASDAAKADQSAALTGAAEKAKKMIAERRAELEAIARARREELIAEGKELIADFRANLLDAIEESVPGEGSRNLYEQTVKIMKEAAARLCDKDMTAALEKDPEKFVSELKLRSVTPPEELRAQVFDGLNKIHGFFEKTWEDELASANVQHVIGRDALHRHVEWLMSSDPGLRKIRETAEQSFIGSLPAFNLGSETTRPAISPEEAVKALQEGVRKIARFSVAVLLRDEYQDRQLKISRQTVESLIARDGIKDAPVFKRVRDRVWQMFEERRKTYEEELFAQTSDNVLKFSEGPLLLSMTFIGKVSTEIRRGVLDAVFGPLERTVPEATREQHCEGVAYLGQPQPGMASSLVRVINESNAKVDTAIKSVLAEIREKYASLSPTDVIAAAKPLAGGSALRREIADRMNEVLAPIKRDAEFRYLSEKNYLECRREAESRFEGLFAFLPDGTELEDLPEYDRYGDRLQAFESRFMTALDDRMNAIRKEADRIHDDPARTRDTYDRLFDQLMNEDDIRNSDGSVREESLKTQYADLKNLIAECCRRHEITAWGEAIRTFVDKSIADATRLPNFGLNALPDKLRNDINKKIEHYAQIFYEQEVWQNQGLLPKQGASVTEKIPVLSPTKVFGKEQLERMNDLKDLIAEAQKRGVAAYLVDAKLFGALVMQLGDKAQKYPTSSNTDLRPRGGKDRIGLWGWTRTWRTWGNLIIPKKADYPQVLGAQKEVQDFVRETIINELVREVTVKPEKEVEGLVKKLADSILAGESLVRKEVNRVLTPVYKSVFVPAMKKAEDAFAAEYKKKTGSLPSPEDRQQASAALEGFFQLFQLNLHVGIMKYMAQNLALKIGEEQKDPTATVKVHYGQFLEMPVSTLIEKGFFDKEFFGDLSLASSKLFKDVVVKALLDKCSTLFKDVDVKASISEGVDLDFDDVNDD